jgi:hypothetical protein
MTAMIGMPYLLFLPSKPSVVELASTSALPIMCQTISTPASCECDEVVTRAIKPDVDATPDDDSPSESVSTRFDSNSSHLCSSEEEEEFDLDCFNPCQYIEAADEDEVTDEMRVALFLAGLQKRQRILSRITELPEEGELSFCAAPSIASMAHAQICIIKQ